MTGNACTCQCRVRCIQRQFFLILLLPPTPDLRNADHQPFLCGFCAWVQKNKTLYQVGPPTEKYGQGTVSLLLNDSITNSISDIETNNFEHFCSVFEQVNLMMLKFKWLSQTVNRDDSDLGTIVRKIL